MFGVLKLHKKKKIKEERKKREGGRGERERKEKEGRKEGGLEGGSKEGEKNKLYLISSTKTVFTALTSHLPVAWHGFTASKPAEILEVKIQYNNWLTDLKKDRQIFPFPRFISPALRLIDRAGPAS